MRVIMAFLVSISTLLGLSLANPIENTPQSTESAPAAITCIVMDLGGVLVDSSTSGAISEMGLNNLLSLIYHHNGDQHAIKKSYFDILNKIDNTNPAEAYDESGLRLPSLMCDWLMGKKENSVIFHQIMHALHDEKQTLCTHKSVLKSFKAMTHMIFSPRSFINAQSIHTDTVEFIKKCKKKGYMVIALSNWDKESFELLHARHNKVFSLFDDVIISGYVGSLKPHPEIYSHILKNHAPNTCVLIDDQPQNIATARSLGMYGILVEKTKKLFSSKPNIGKVHADFLDLTISLPPLKLVESHA